MEAALSGGPWMFGKSSLSVRKWSPNMELNDSFFETASAWVRLPGLSLEYWVEDVFLGITNSFGELVAIDPITSSCKRLVIYVNISQNMDLPSTIDISSKLGLWEQSIEFESLPFVCFSCKKAGHWAKACPSNPKKPVITNIHKQVWKEKNNNKEGNKLEGKSISYVNISEPSEGDRIDLPKNPPMKENKNNEIREFEIKTVNTFEALQTQEKENEINEETLEDGEIENITNSNHEVFQDSISKKDEQCLDEFEEHEIKLGRSNKFGSPQVNLNALFQNIGVDTPTSSQKRGELWSNMQDETRVEQEENITGNGKKIKTKKVGGLNGVKTRTRSKADFGASRSPLGRKTMKWHRDQESKQNIADGRQRAIKESCPQASK